MKIKMVSPRKQPKQERSKQMIELIIEVSTHILQTQGFDLLTTNLVAKKAGISIGSLYQYFPNKESLVLALILKTMQADSEIFEKQFLKSLEMNPILTQVETFVKLMVKSFFDLHSQETKLRAEIYALIFKLGANKDVLYLREQMINKVSVIIQKIHPSKSKEEIQAKAFVVFYSCLGVMQGIVFHPEDRTRINVENELIRMITGILMS